ncbi:MAG: hypothetical protein ACREOK_00515 [Gemmatimonadaceae bacterium]
MLLRLFPPVENQKRGQIRSQRMNGTGGVVEKSGEVLRRTQHGLTQHHQRRNDADVPRGQLAPECVASAVGERIGREKERMVHAVLPRGEKYVWRARDDMTRELQVVRVRSGAERW